jgi:alkanesulfonate monooxygenase SsuD/methylene tetrahydromethanopterin reductase-like flavin-dependent oxidoreductase (luciferase family)
MKNLILNVFIHASPSITAGVWKHPLDESERYNTTEYWCELAQIAERGKLNALFFADYLAYYDVYKGPNNWKLPASGGYFIPKVDPGVLVSSMAQATKSLSFGVTFSTIREDPTLFGRRLWSLDHASEGRVGWNIVTSYAPAAGRQLLNGPLPTHEERYKRAIEYVDKAVTEIVGFDSSKKPESPQRLPVLIQAGTSSQGKLLGIEHAECIFINAWDRVKAKIDIKAIRDLAVEYGRDPKELKIITMATPIVANTKEEAEAKVELIRKNIFRDAPAIGFGTQSHIDLSNFEWNDPIIINKTEGGQSVTQNYINVDNKYQKKGEIIEKGLRVTSLVGNPTEIADWFEQYVNEIDIDGFNLIFPVNHESLSDFVDLVVPELQRRGLFWEDYAVPGGTFRENIYGVKGQTFFPGTHPIHNVAWNGEGKEEYEAKVKKWHLKREVLKKRNAG